MHQILIHFDCNCANHCCVSVELFLLQQACMTLCQTILLVLFCDVTEQ